MANRQSTVVREVSAAHTILLETRTLTEARNESADSDADRANILLETQTVSKTNNEARDSDSDSDTKTSVGWISGERRPLHFRNISDAKDAPAELKYDEDLDMCIDNLRRPLISAGYAPETHTLTSTRSETNDSDK